MERRSRRSIGRQETKYSEDTDDELDDCCHFCYKESGGHQEPCINNCNAWLCESCVNNLPSMLPWCCGKRACESSARRRNNNNEDEENEEEDTNNDNNELDEDSEEEDYDGAVDDAAELLPPPQAQVRRRSPRPPQPAPPDERQPLLASTRPSRVQNHTRPQRRRSIDGGDVQRLGRAPSRQEASDDIQPRSRSARPYRGVQPNRDGHTIYDVFVPRSQSCDLVDQILRYELLDIHRSQWVGNGRSHQVWIQMSSDLNRNSTPNSLYKWAQRNMRSGHPLHVKLAEDVEWLRRLGMHQYEYNLRHGIVYSFQGDHPPAMIPRYNEATPNRPQPRWYSRIDTRVEEMMKKITHLKCDLSLSNTKSRYWTSKIKLNYLHEVTGLVIYNQGARDEFMDQVNNQDHFAIYREGRVPLNQEHYLDGFREFIGASTEEAPHTLDSARTLRDDINELPHIQLFKILNDFGGEWQATVVDRAMARSPDENDPFIKDTPFSRQVSARLDNNEICHLIDCNCHRFRGTGVARMIYQFHHYNAIARMMKRIQSCLNSRGLPLNPSRYSEDQMTIQSPYVRLCCANAHPLLSFLENTDLPEDEVDGHNYIADDQFIPPSLDERAIFIRRAFWEYVYKNDTHSTCIFSGMNFPQNRLRSLCLHHVFGSYNTLVGDYLFETKKHIEYSQMGQLPVTDDTVHAQCCFYEMVNMRPVEAALHSHVWHRLEMQMESLLMIESGLFEGFPFEKVSYGNEKVWKYTGAAEEIFGPDAMQLLEDASDGNGFISLHRPKEVVLAIDQYNARGNGTLDDEESDDGTNAMDMDAQADHLPENARVELNQLQEGKTEEGCCICHEDKDHEKLWKCQDCSNEYHLSCLVPPPTNPDQPHCQRCNGIMRPLDIGQDESNNGTNAETGETLVPENEVEENDNAENEETFAPEIEVEENEGRSEGKLWWRLGDEENVPENPFSVGLYGFANGRSVMIWILQGQSLALGFGDEHITINGVSSAAATIRVVSIHGGVAIEIMGSTDMRIDELPRFGVRSAKRRSGEVEYSELLSATDVSVPVLYLTLNSEIVSSSHSGEILVTFRLSVRDSLSPLRNQYVFVPHDEAVRRRRQRRLGNREENNNNNADAEVDAAAEMNDEDIEVDGGGELADVEMGAEVAADAEMDIEAIEEEAAGEQYQQQHPQAYLGNMVRVNMWGERMDEDED